MSTRYLVLLAGCAVVVWAYSRWRQAVQATMVLLIFEGAIRKWVFPGAQDLIYLAKDAILLAAYCGFFTERAHLRVAPRPPKPLLVALSLAMVVGFLEIFNPRLPNLLVGLLGFKAYFLYVPLIFVLPATFADDRDLARYLRRYVLIAIPVGLLAIAQFFSPASSPLNTYARGDADYATTFGSSTYVRVTGTFSYITGYSSYLLSTAILLLGFLAVTGWQFRRQTKIFVALTMTLLGMLMSGSRGPVFMLVLLFPLYWMLGMMREKGSGAAFGRIVLIMGLVIAAVVVSAPQAVDAFRGRAAGSTDVGGRLLTPFLAPLSSFEHGGLLGFGIGATHQQATAVTKGMVPFSWMRGIVVEAESGQIMLEIGPLGFACFYFARVYLIVFALGQARRLRTRFHRALATACFLFFLAQLTGAVVFDLTTGLYFWFFGGLLMLVMRLDREMLVAARAAAAQGPAPGRARQLPLPDGLPIPVPAGRRRRPPTAAPPWRPRPRSGSW